MNTGRMNQLELPNIACCCCCLCYFDSAFLYFDTATHQKGHFSRKNAAL